MNFNSKKFTDLFPRVLLPVFDEIFNQGLKATVVGGLVRDFLLHEKIGHDWDIELTHGLIPFEKSYWKELGKSLGIYGKLTYLPYEVIRLKVDSYQLEFSPPRLEHFFSDKKGHSNFEAEFNFNLPFSQAVKRRDFTINAMGVKIGPEIKVEFLDPLNGLKDLENKTLHFAGEDFDKDPVRFLRAYRFANKFELHFSPELKEVLGFMSVTGITPAYLWSELGKTKDPINFLTSILKDKKNELRLPVDESFILKKSNVRKNLLVPLMMESWLISLEWADLDSLKWANFFSMPQDYAKRITRWASTSKLFLEVMPEKFHGNFEEVINDVNFNILFDWYFTTRNLLHKTPSLPLLQIIQDQIPIWSCLFKWDLPQDVKHIDPPLRAKYQLWNLCQRL